MLETLSKYLLNFIWNPKSFYSYLTKCSSGYFSNILHEFDKQFIWSFNELDKDNNCKTRQDTFKFWELARLLLETWRYSLLQ